MKLTYNPFAKINRIESNNYIEFVKTCPPITPGGGDIVPHHVDITGGCTGGKPSDIFAVPLYFDKHVDGSLAIHKLGTANFERIHNVDMKFQILKMLEYYITNGGKF